jgi:hypothetical protein
MGKLMARYSSSGDLYPLHGASTSSPQAMITPVGLWHRRIGHPNKTTLSSLLQEFCIPNTSSPHDSFVMHVNVANMLDYPLVARPRLNYYIVIYGHPRFLVSLVLNIILLFLTIIPIISGQFLFSPSLMSPLFFRIFAMFYTFGHAIQFIQCDNGREYDNIKNRDFFLSLTSSYFVSLVKAEPFSSLY